MLYSILLYSIQILRLTPPSCLYKLMNNMYLVYKRFLSMSTRQIHVKPINVSSGEEPHPPPCKRGGAIRFRLTAYVLCRIRQRVKASIGSPSLRSGEGRGYGECGKITSIRTGRTALQSVRHSLAGRHALLSYTFRFVLAPHPSQRHRSPFLP
jgi:hypothetical protein